MNKGLLRKISLFTVLVMGLSGLCGCSFFQSVNLDDEQTELVAEYAAGKLLQYSKGHENGIEQVQDLNFEELNPGYVAPEEEIQETDTEENIAPSEKASSENEVVDENTDEGALVPEISGDDSEPLVDVPEIATKSIADVFNMEGTDVSYNYYESCKTYPESSDSLVFSMKAATGKDLLILHFNVMNTSSGPVQISNDSDDFKVRASVNGGKKIRGELTFLDNDLMNYSKTLEAGETADTILVFETDEGTEILSLDLILIDNEQSEHTYRLFG